MPRCPSCQKRLPDNNEDTGARCPRCRAPLYEREPSLRGALKEIDGQCVAHQASSAAGTCQRCGNFVCAVCRTRWQRRIVCLACLERGLQSHEASPEVARAHYLQALWSIIFGVGGWALLLTGTVLFAIGIRNGPENPAVVAVVPALLLLLAAPCLVVPGLGLGAGAVRSRGDHLVLATIGLVLSALMAGAIIGAIAITSWRS